MKAGQSAAKSEETKSRIVGAALELFKNKGYDETTMRMIAAEAEVSVGNAYHYFSSKEELMQGYYDEIATSFEIKAREALKDDGSFAERLERVLKIWLEVAQPFHAFAQGFFAKAANPSSPLSPFSPESQPARQINIGIMREVIDGSGKLRMSSRLRERLPDLLWMYQMGIVAYWVHDQTAERKNTKALIERTTPMVANLTSLTRLPILKGTADDVIDLIEKLVPSAFSKKLSK